MPGYFDTPFGDAETTGFFGGYRRPTPLPPQAATDDATVPVADGTGSDGAGAAQPRTAVAVNLRGLAGPTYLDSEFADRLHRFEQYASGHGVQPKYINGYRSPEYQAYLRATGQGTTPAQRSLHSAGLAVDVQYRKQSPEEQKILRDAAAQAGLGWGGNFRNPGADVNHFYFDPGGDRQALIDNFSEQIDRLQSRQQGDTP
ncbi:MAG: M15 family metallopeptidase [Alphaproteobacteria bacterium]|nr:M15 family metallopeptidase [Alphaproteobacteria bacterium]